MNVLGYTINGGLSAFSLTCYVSVKVTVVILKIEDNHPLLVVRYLKFIPISGFFYLTVESGFDETVILYYVKFVQELQANDLLKLIVHVFYNALHISL